MGARACALGGRAIPRRRCGLDPTIDPTRPPPLDRFCIAGTPQDVAVRVEELWDAGADRVELGTPQGRSTPAGIELICDRVLPLLRA